MKLLNQLTRFYQNEARGLPQHEEDLLNLAWELADALERMGVDSNVWKSYDEEKI